MKANFTKVGTVREKFTLCVFLSNNDFLLFSLAFHKILSCENKKDCDFIDNFKRLLLG